MLSAYAKTPRISSIAVENAMSRKNVILLVRIISRVVVNQVLKAPSQEVHALLLRLRRSNQSLPNKKPLVEQLQAVV